MSRRLIQLTLKEDLRGEVKAHELEISGESLDLLLLFLLEHGHGVPFNFCFEHELVTILFILLVPWVL